MTDLGILITMSLIGAAMAAYTFGWWWRGRHERIVRTEKVSRPLTAEERRAFDEAFNHMSKAFDAFRKVQP